MFVFPSRSHSLSNEDNSVSSAKQRRVDPSHALDCSIVVIPKEIWSLIVGHEPKSISLLTRVCKELSQKMQYPPIIAQLFEATFSHYHDADKFPIFCALASYSNGAEVRNHIKHLDLSFCPREATNKLLKDCPNCESLNLTSISITNEDFENIVVRFPNLKDLKLNLPIDSRNQIIGKGWKHLGFLTQLKRLELKGCAITDAELENVSTLTQLNHLDLSYCEQINGIGLQYLRNLPSLETLHFSGKQYIQEWKHLKCLTQLKRLSLIERNMTDVESENFLALHQLKHLDLSNWSRLPREINGGYIQRIGLYELQGLGNLSHLKTLNLSNSPYLTPRLEQLKDLHELEELNLSGVDGDQLQYLSHLSQLHTLILSKSDISNKDLIQLQPLKQLKTLLLDNCSEISITGIKNLKSLSQLRTLALSGCEKIQDAHLQHLSIRLERLDLNGCKITDEGLEHLKRLKNLKVLNLLGCNQVSKRACDWFINRKINVCLK